MIITFAGEGGVREREREREREKWKGKESEQAGRRTSSPKSIN